MRKKLKLIPSFASEEEERLFWETHDSFDYVDWDQCRPCWPSQSEVFTRD